MPSSNVCWGIEVGSAAIKAMRIEREGDSLRVGDFVVLPHKRVLSTPGIERDEAMRLALGSFMSQFRENLRGTRIALSMPGHSAFARFAKLPPVEPKGVPDLVRFEAVQQIPFPIDEVEWDYQTFASEDSPDVEVGIFAATSERINEMLAMYGEVGLTPDLINLSPVCAYNAIAYDLAFTEQTPGTVIIDIGTMATDLIIADSGKVWMRTFPLGGHSFTEALGETFKLDYPKAEKLKREAETSKYKRHIFQALRPILTELVQDIQRSIGYYQDTHPEADIKRVIGCGSTFKLIGLRKLLSQQLKLDVYRLEHYKRLQIDGAASSDFEAAVPQLATAYGLALQGLGLANIDANLMPVPVIRQALWQRKTKWFVTAATLGLVASGLTFLSPFLQNGRVQAAAGDPAVTRTIQDAIQTGNRLKQEWQQASAGENPGMVAQNMIKLTSGHDLYIDLLADVNAMLADAAAKAPLASGDALASRLHRFDTQYVAPGKPLHKATAPASGDARGRRGRRGGESYDAENEEPIESGTYGAVELTLEFESSLNDRAFLNDTVLAWLTRYASRPEAKYEFINIPDPTAVPITEFVIEANPAKDAQTPPSSTRPAPTRAPRPARRQPTRGGGGLGGGGLGGSGLGGSGLGGGGLGGGGSAPPPQSRPDRLPPQTKSDAALEELAPIPENVLHMPAEGNIYRYTVIWQAQLRDPSAPPPSSDSPEGQSSPTARGSSAGEEASS